MSANLIETRRVGCLVCHLSVDECIRRGGDGTVRFNTQTNKHSLEVGMLYGPFVCRACGLETGHKDGCGFGPGGNLHGYSTVVKSDS